MEEVVQRGHDHTGCHQDAEPIPFHVGDGLVAVITATELDAISECNRPTNERVVRVYLTLMMPSRRLRACGDSAARSTIRDAAAPIMIGTAPTRKFYGQSVLSIVTGAPGRRRRIFVDRRSWRLLGVVVRVARRRECVNRSGQAQLAIATATTRPRGRPRSRRRLMAAGPGTAPLLAPERLQDASGPVTPAQSCATARRRAR